MWKFTADSAQVTFEEMKSRSLREILARQEEMFKCVRTDNPNSEKYWNVFHNYENEHLTRALHFIERHGLTRQMYIEDDQGKTLEGKGLLENMLTAMEEAATARREAMTGRAAEGLDVLHHQERLELCPPCGLRCHSADGLGRAVMQEVIAILCGHIN